MACVLSSSSTCAFQNGQKGSLRNMKSVFFELSCEASIWVSEVSTPLSTLSTVSEGERMSPTLAVGPIGSASAICDCYCYC